MFTPDVISPQQRLIDTHTRGAHQIDHAWIPLYGLPVGWPGFRLTGDTRFETGVTRDVDGVTAEVHESVELVHQQGLSLLAVESSDQPLSIDDADLLDLLGTAGTCTPLTISVDGRAVAFASAHTQSAFVARWAGYASTVTVRGEHWPMAFGLELVRVTDVAPYHQGRLRMLEQRCGLSLRD